MSCYSIYDISYQPFIIAPKHFFRLSGDDISSMCFAYTRQSSSKQQSLKEQCDLCINHAKKNGYKWIVVFQDKGSAWKKGAMDNLKGQNLMMRNISKFEPHVIYIFDVSRFGRDVGASLSLLNKISMKGLTVESITDGRVWNTDEFKRDDFTQSLLEARRFSTLVSNRVKQRNNYTLKNGGNLGNPKFGFHAIKERGIRKFKIDKSEQGVISFIKKSMDKMTYGQIVDLLHTKGSTKRGKPWTLCNVASTGKLPNASSKENDLSDTLGNMQL